MKRILLLAICGALLHIEQALVCTAGAQEDGVALAIVCDTSGSMKERVRDADGKEAPKYVVANRALKAVAKQIEFFATNSVSGQPRKIQAGLFVFAHDRPSEAIPFGPFTPSAFQDWANRFSTPGGYTPLGNALMAAGQRVVSSPLSRKHVLIITDGINTAGPDPARVMPTLKELATRKQSTVSVHFVAFDVDAKVFDAVKKLGAMVVGAADEKQLNTQLEFILQRKILLEDEEPAKQ